MDIVIVLTIIAVAVFWMSRGEKPEVKVETPVAPVQPEIDLDQMTKAELLELAEQLDAKVAKSWTKAKIVAAIVAALQEQIRDAGF